MNIALKQLLHFNFFYLCQNKQASKQVEIFRIFIALYSIVTFLLLLLNYDVFFSPEGFINWEVTNASNYWFELHPEKISLFFGIEPKATIVILITLYIISLITLLFGILPRISALLSLLLFITFSNMLTPYGYGVDVYHSLSFFFLIIFPTGYQFAIKKRPITPQVETVQAICIRTFQIYLSLTYLNAGVEKALMPNWWNGKFIFYLINDPTLIAHKIIATDLPVSVYTLLGIIVLLIESLYIILVWIPVVRTIIILTIILMHIFIAFSMGLTSFGILLIGLNITIWYPSIQNDIQKFLKYGKKI